MITTQPSEMVQGNLIVQVNQAKTFSELLLGGEDVGKGYKRLAALLHPDVCKFEGGEEAFKRLGELRDIYVDEIGRAHV